MKVKGRALDTSSSPITRHTITIIIIVIIIKTITTIRTTKIITITLMMIMIIIGHRILSSPLHMTV